MTRSDLAPLLIALHDLQEQITLDKRHCYRMNKATVPGVTTVIRTLDAPALDAWKVRVQVEGTARAAFHNPPPTDFIDNHLDSVWLAAEVDYVERLTAIAKLEFEHERLANEAADVGKQVHALIEHAVREQLGQASLAPEATDEALFIFAGWREWAASVGLRPIAAEGRVGWPINQTPPSYAGTFDILTTFDRGEFKDQIAIIDAKPNARIYPERRLQLAAYSRPVRDLCALHGLPGVVRGMVVALPRDGGEIEMVVVDPTEEDFDAFIALLHVYRWEKEVAKASRKAAKEEAA